MRFQLKTRRLARECAGARSAEIRPSPIVMWRSLAAWLTAIQIPVINLRLSKAGEKMKIQNPAENPALTPDERIRAKRITSAIAETYRQAEEMTRAAIDLDGFGPDAMTVVFAFAAIERLAGHVETYLYSTGASPADTEATVNALAAAVRETLKRRLAT